MNKVVVVFTGTRKGMSLNQKLELCQVLDRWHNSSYEIEWHHGCCEGADVEFDGIVRKYNKYGHLHPSTYKKTRVDCFEANDKTFECDELYQPLPPLMRDMEMVKHLKSYPGKKVLIAAPKSDTRVIRSGTLTTVRYAEKFNSTGQIEINILKR
jgi:hypothetical protein